MADHRLTQYIHVNLEKGIPKEHIFQALKRSGYSEREIYKAISSTHTLKVPERSKRDLTLAILIILTALILLVGLTMIIFLFDEPSDTPQITPPKEPEILEETPKVLTKSPSIKIDKPTKSELTNQFMFSATTDKSSNCEFIVVAEQRITRKDMNTQNGLSHNVPFLPAPSTDYDIVISCIDSAGNEGEELIQFSSPPEQVSVSQNPTDTENKENIPTPIEIPNLEKNELTKILDNRPPVDIKLPDESQLSPEQPEQSKRIDILGIGTDAYFEITSDEIVIIWENPAEGQYSLILKEESHKDWNIYYGGHPIGKAPVNFQKYNLDGSEKLIGQLWHYAADRHFLAYLPEFMIDLETKTATPLIEEQEPIEKTIEEPIEKLVETFSITNSGIGAVYEKTSDKIVIKWSNPEEGSYSLSLKLAGDAGWAIYYGRHPREQAPVVFSEKNMIGNETLIGRFTQYAEDLSFVQYFPEFQIALNESIEEPDVPDDKNETKPPPKEIPKEPDPITERWTNPTAPNEYVKFLAGDFTDTDGDGMTDIAELKYDFDPNNAASFPEEPEVILPEQFIIEDSGIGAYFEVGRDSIELKWTNPEDGSYYLSLKKEGDREWDIYYGGHYPESAAVELDKFGLSETDVLKGRFTKYGLDLNFIQYYSEFNIDLSSVDFPDNSEIGKPTNKISYTFSDDFPSEAEKSYRKFLKRVWPILQDRLGPPAESFNVFIKNMGEDTSFFMITNNGRTFLTDTDFIPRLIAHEFVHAWKGQYSITTGDAWQYQPDLSGFEEGMAEGLAFDIIHEYVRSYPNDEATIKLLNWRPYQYWSSRTTYYDSIKNTRWSGAGKFWTDASGQRNRYSIAATTVQMMLLEQPTFTKDFSAAYYSKIREEPEWRTNREDILNMWENIVPEVNDLPLRTYLNSLPVFNGHNLDEGLYVLSTIRPYGTQGDQQFALGYAIRGDICFDNDGMVWWGICDKDLDEIPSWLNTMKTDDNFTYIDTQGSAFTVDVRDAKNNKVLTNDYKTRWDRREDGGPSGFGWVLLPDLAFENFEQGLYKETVTFSEFTEYDSGASESFYFIGLNGFSQDRSNEYVVMIGVDGVAEGTVDFILNGESFTEPIVKGLAIAKSITLPFDTQESFDIKITDKDGVSHTYRRTLLEAGTVRNFFQHQFIIVDTNFNGIEDQFE